MIFVKCYDYLFTFIEDLIKVRYDYNKTNLSSEDIAWL